jgi:hypothetical protein
LTGGGPHVAPGPVESSLAKSSVTTTSETIAPDGKSAAENVTLRVISLPSTDPSVLLVWVTVWASAQAGNASTEKASANRRTGRVQDKGCYTSGAPANAPHQRPCCRQHAPGPTGATGRSAPRNANSGKPRPAPSGERNACGAPCGGAHTDAQPPAYSSTLTVIGGRYLARGRFRAGSLYRTRPPPRG